MRVAEFDRPPAAHCVRVQCVVAGQFLQHGVEADLVTGPFGVRQKLQEAAVQAVREAHIGTVVPRRPRHGLKPTRLGGFHLLNQGEHFGTGQRLRMALEEGIQAVPRHQIGNLRGLQAITSRLLQNLVGVVQKGDCRDGGKALGQFILVRPDRACEEIDLPQLHRAPHHAAEVVQQGHVGESCIDLRSDPIGGPSAFAGPPRQKWRPRLDPLALRDLSLLCRVQSTATALALGVAEGLRDDHFLQEVCIDCLGQTHWSGLAN